jgi:uncharacterized protein (DUF885 family)
MTPSNLRTPSTPSGDLAKLADEYLTALFETYPQLAASLGLHEYDGRVQDFREAARATRLAAVTGFAARLDAIPSEALEEEDAHDHTLLRLSVAEERFDLESLRDVERNPLAYSGALDVSGYVKRQYAPLPRRVAALVQHLLQFPDVLRAARDILQPHIARPFIETALEVYAGTIQFHEQDLLDAVRPVAPSPLWDEFERANGAARRALEEFVHYLRDELLPRATDEFAIGEDHFLTMLHVGEMVDLPLDRLLEMGREDMARNVDHMRAAARRIDPTASVADVIRRQSRDHPPADRLIAEAAKVLDELRVFVEEHGVVTIPSSVRCRVEETPPFARWAFAMMDTAGPFETSTESFYYVTPPDPGWTPEQTEAWLSKFDYATLRDVGIHEVYPGHFVHFLHMKHVPRRVRQVLTSYSFVEGWAHYCEEMMVEEGYGRSDPRLEIAQLSEALLRNVRFLVSIHMHTRGLSVESATQWFVDNAYLEPLPAHKEAVRGTFDPGYLNYTLGKLMIRRVRDGVRTREGARFTLRRFHDSLLALGAPPVPLARRRLLGDGSEAL